MPGTPRVWDDVQGMVTANAASWLQVQIPGERTDELGSQAPLEPGASYLRLWLCELSLGGRDIPPGSWLPVVHGGVRLSYGDRQATFSRVVQPPLPARRPEAIRMRRRLTDLLPFNGGAVAVQAALVAVADPGFLGPAVDVLERMSALVTPRLGQATALAEELSAATSDLLSATGSQLRLGIHQELGSDDGSGPVLQPGYLAAILAGPDEFATDQLFVRDDRLLYRRPGREPTPIEGFTYLLLRVEGLPERDDWRLADIQEPLDLAVQALGEAPRSPAKVAMVRTLALAAAWRSPDLARRDRRRVMRAIRDELAEIEAQGLGAVGSGWHSLDEIVSSRAMPPEQADALGDLSPGEVLNMLVEASLWDFDSVLGEPVGLDPDDLDLLGPSDPAPPAPPVPPSPEAPVRRLQAEVTDAATGRRREHAFAPGAEHTIGVHVGPGDAGPLALASSFDESKVRYDTPAGAVLDVEFVSEGSDGAERQRQLLLLPRTGPTAQAQFTLVVDAAAREVRCSVLVFQGARLLQSAELAGPVSPEDTPVGDRRLRLVSTADIIAVPTDEVPDPGLDAALCFHVGERAEEALLVSAGRSRVIRVQGLDELRERIVALLQRAVDDDAFDEAAPGSSQQQELLRGLARQGSQLHDRLQSEIGDLSIERGIQLTTSEDAVIPLEFVYDFGYPSENARLCKHWREALEQGRCSCRPTAKPRRVICPLGFWGVRMVIERQLATTGGQSAESSLAGQPRPGHETLPALERVLFSASARVDRVSRGERKRTVDLLRQRLGDGCVLADNWKAWKRVVAEHRPGLLLSLPHNDSAADGLPLLEIGRRSRLELGALTDEHIVAPGTSVGPVVLLLGCDTAVADIPWQSAAATFRRRGASVVVGTLAVTLGRQTAPMARLVADALWGPTAITEPTMGAVMQTVRRRLLAEGWTLGMSLVAFGHTDWQMARKEG